MEKTKVKTRAEGVTRGRAAGDLGGSLAGYLTASYRDLVKVLGRPNCEGDGYKTSTEWELTFRGRTYTIYDYKDTKLYDRALPSVQAFRRMPSFDWHIGAEGGSKANVSEFRNVIVAAVEALGKDR